MKGFMTLGGNFAGPLSAPIKIGAMKIKVVANTNSAPTHAGLMRHLLTVHTTSQPANSPKTPISLKLA